MVSTWSESWFEEGTRLFYFMPQSKVDEILPLQIRPEPASIVRAFVGRMELLTPAARENLEKAIMASDTGAMLKYGRFLQPFADIVLARADARSRAVLEQRLKDNAFTLWSGFSPAAAAATCK
jgi:hypothetical protein